MTEFLTLLVANKRSAQGPDEPSHRRFVNLGLVILVLEEGFSGACF